MGDDCVPGFGLGTRSFSFLRRGISGRTENLRPLQSRLDDDIRLHIHQILGSKTEGTPQRPGSGVARCLHIHGTVADHHRLFRFGGGLFHEREQPHWIGFLCGKTVATKDVQKVAGEAQPFTDAACRANRLVGKNRHRSRRAAGSIVQLMERFQCFKNSLVGICKVEFVFTVILKKESVGFGKELFVHLLGSQPSGQRKRSPHECGRAISDKTGNRRIGQWIQVELHQGRIYAVAEVLRGIDERAIEVEDEQFQVLHRDRSNDTDHVSSLTAAEHGQERPEGRIMNVHRRMQRERWQGLNKHVAILAVPLILAMGVKCSIAQPPRFSSDPAAERIPNLDKLKQELRQYHDCTCKCGCYDHDIDLQANKAIAFLRRRAAHRRPDEKLALILDIDETTLSNYIEETGADFAYKAKAFDTWVQSAQATAIPGTLHLYKEAEQLGVTIFFITGRPETERIATERNLRAQGFDHWKLLVMRPATGSQTIGEFKQKTRAEISAQGYTLALNVGDQWSDLRGKPEAEFSVKYPDPFYLIP